MRIMTGKGEQELVIAANSNMRHGKKVVRTNCKGDLLKTTVLQIHAVAFISMEFTTTSVYTYVHVYIYVCGCVRMFVCMYTYMFTMLSNISHRSLIPETSPDMKSFIIAVA